MKQACSIAYKQWIFTESTVHVFIIYIKIKPIYQLPQDVSHQQEERILS